MLFTLAGLSLLLFTSNTWGVDKVEITGLDPGADQKPKKEKEETYSGFGPLDSRNNTPLQLMFLNFAPDRAKVLPHRQMEVKLNEVYGNVSLRGNSEHWRSRMDMEVSRAAFQVRVGLWDLFELGIEVPYIYQWHGTLDSTINGFHRAFGLPSRDRFHFRDNHYSFFMVKDRETYVMGNDHNNGLGDIVLDVKIQLLKEEKYLPAVSLKPALKVPSGDASKIMGNGKADGGLCLLLEKNYKPFHLYVNIGVVFTGQNSRGANVKTHEIYHALAGVEYSLTKDLGLNLQVVMNSSPLRHTRVRFLNNPGVEIDFGFRYRIYKNVILQLAMIQDLTTGAPDVSLIGGVKFTF